MGNKYLGSLFAYLDLDASKWDKELNRVSRNLKNQGRQFDQIGKGLTTAFTLPLAAAAGASIKFASDLNRSMSNVATLIPNNTARVEELRSGLQSLSVSANKSTDDLSDGLYQVISAFGDTKNSLASVELASKAATAGLASTRDSVNLISAVTKGYGDTSLETQKKVSDLAFTAVKLGQTTFPELASSMGRVVPLASEMKVSQEELFAVMATGTGVTGTAAEVSTQLRGVLQSLLAPTKDMSGLFQELGIKSGKVLLEQRGLAGAIQTIVERAAATNTPLQKYIGSVEGMTLALSLAGNQSTTFQEKLAAMQEANGATAEAFEQVAGGLNSLGFAFGQLQKAATTTLQKIGQVLLDNFGDEMVGVIEFLKDTLVSVGDSFQSLSPEMQKFITIVGGMVAAVGPLTIAIGGALTVLGAITALVTGPFSIGFAAATVAIGAAVTAWNLWGESVSENFSILFDVIYERYEPAIEFMRTIWDAWANYLIERVQMVKDFFAGFIEYLSQSFSWIRENLNAILEYAEYLPVIGVSAQAWRAVSKELEEISTRTAEVKAQNMEYKRSMDELVKAAGGVENIKKKYEDLKGKLSDSVRSFLGLKTAADETKTALDGVGDEGEKTGNKLGGTGSGSLGSKAKKAEEALADLREALEKTQSAAEKLKIDTGIKSAIQDGDSAALNYWLEALRDHTEKGITEGFKRSGGVVSEEARKLIQANVDAEVDARKKAEEGELAEIRAKAAVDAGKKYQEELERAHTESVSFFEDIFIGAVDGRIEDTFKNMFRRVLIKFGAELAAQVTGNFSSKLFFDGISGGTSGNSFASLFSSATGGGLSFDTLVDAFKAAFGIQDGANTKGTTIDYGGTVEAYNSIAGNFGGGISTTAGAGSTAALGTSAATLGLGAAAAVLAYFGYEGLSAGYALASKPREEFTNDDALQVAGTFFNPNAFVGIGYGINEVFGGDSAKYFSQLGWLDPATAPLYIADALGANLEFLNFGSGKSSGQMSRDALRDFLRDSGVTNNDHILSLFGGGEYNIGKDEVPLNEFESVKVSELTPNNEQFIGLGNLLASITTGGENPTEFGGAGAMFANALASADSFNAAVLTTLEIMEELGFTTETAGDLLLEAMLEGKLSLEDYNAEMATLQKLSSFSLESITEGFQLLADTAGGPPKHQIKALELTFQELKESGIQDTQAMLSYIRDTFGPEAANYFEILASHGIDLFTDFSTLTQDQMGLIANVLSQLIPAMEDVGFASADSADEIEGSASRMSKALRGVEEQARKTEQAIKDAGSAESSAESSDGSGGSDSGSGSSSGGLDITGVSGYDEWKNQRVRAFAKGGIVGTPTMFNIQDGLAGEAGPEAIIPLRAMSNGELGVGFTGGGGEVHVHYNIDARNAQAGVSEEIMTALRYSERQAVRGAVQAVYEMRRRGVM